MLILTCVCFYFPHYISSRDSKFTTKFRKGHFENLWAIEKCQACEGIKLGQKIPAFDKKSSRLTICLTLHFFSVASLNHLLPDLPWICLTHVVKLLTDSKFLGAIRGLHTQKRVKEALCWNHFGTLQSLLSLIIILLITVDIPKIKKHTLTMGFNMHKILWMTCLGGPGFSNFLKSYGKLWDQKFSNLFCRSNILRNHVKKNIILK